MILAIIKQIVTHFFVSLLHVEAFMLLRDRSFPISISLEFQIKGDSCSFKKKNGRILRPVLPALSCIDGANHGWQKKMLRTLFFPVVQRTPDVQLPTVPLESTPCLSIRWRI